MTELVPANPAVSRRTWRLDQVFPATAALVVAACVPIYAFIWQQDAPLSHPDLTFWPGTALTVLLIGIFLFCELVPLRVEVRTETMMVALFEFPLVVGFLVLPWYQVLGAQLVAGISVYVLRKDDDWPHSLLNVALVLADTGVALSAMIALAALTHTPTYMGMPLIVAAGVLAGTISSPVIVGLAYRLLGPVEPVWKVIARSSGGACFVIVFAVVEYLLWYREGVIGPYMALALMAAVVMIYLAFRAMMSRHASLNQMYTFIRSVGDTQADNSRWPELMEMVRSQNNAATAVLYLADVTDFMDEPPPTSGGPPKLVGLAVDSNGQVGVAPLGPEDHLFRLAATRGVIRASVDKDTDPAVLEALRARGVKAVMIAALTASDRVRGFVEVRDRLSRWGEFTEEDAEFVGTLSVHMGTALENVQLLANLRNEAYRDSVTGLRSRAGLTVDAEELLSQHRLGALALIQLDTLSQVNNALGHRHGEELLVRAGERILRAGPDRAVARLESDLFAILLEPMTEAELAAEVAGILRLISPSYSLAGVDVEVEPHAGIAVVDEHSLDHPDAAALLQRAEMALLASRSRHERFEIFRPSMGEVYRRRFQLVTQFRAAVDQGHIVVYYQPKVSLADNQLRGVEALVRWMHPEFGMVNPGEFVTAIEATGSIDILLNHVLETALSQIKAWLSRGMRISVAVNLSMRNLTGKQFPERVAAALERHQVPAELLTFELTESNVMTDPETAMPILDALHSMGIMLSVDDFGTGYSSLAYLRRLPIDEIKIDRSFVLGMSTALGDLAIVSSIIELGHSLGLTVIAEGVEEDESRQALTSMKCDGIQGFLLSRPQPVDRFEAWLAARTVRATSTSDLPIMRVVG
ncbi:MAG: sensor domain-containing phosphodiesterase [Nakamurella sp.]